MVVSLVAELRLYSVGLVVAFPGSRAQAQQLWCLGCFPGGSDGKVSACSAGGPGSILGREDPLEKEMATHSSILAWKIPWTEETGRLQSMGSQRVGHD